MDRKKQILIVDDEYLICLSISAILSGHGYHPLSASSGLEAISITDSQPIDLILMDIDLGKGRLDGTEAANKILEKRTIPIIFHTSHAEEGVVKKVKDITRYGYILKNSGTFVLLEAIQMALDLFASHQAVIEKERELARSEKLYRELFDNSNDAILFHSFNEEGIPGSFMEANRVACRRLGYSREELLQLSPQELDEDKSKIPHIMEALISRGDALFETRHRCKDGTSIPVEINAHRFDLEGHPYVISSVRDITKRQEAEDRLRESEHFFKTTLSNITDTVLITDEKGHFTYICPNIHAIFGFSDREVAEMQGLSALIGENDIPYQELEENHELTNKRIEILDKWNRKHVLLSNVKQVRIGKGRRLYTFRDVTELAEKDAALKESERLYRNLSSHLQQLREEQNATLAREIHDDLGQSLTALKMNLTLLDQITDQQDLDISRIQKTLRDIQGITDNTIRKVRTISTELRPTVIDTEGIVEAIEWQIEEFNRLFPVQVNLESIDTEIELGKEKSLHVFRIVQESLTNCIRHSGASTIQIGLERKEEMFLVTIQDNGNGFDPRTIEKQESYGIIGMQERARQCGGTVELESSPGKGTKLNLSVPIEGDSL